MQNEILTVSQLLRSVRDLIERRFPLLWVRGEISNLTRAASGHCYFTLKDGQAQADCVMFRRRLAAVDWDLRDGDRVEARVLVTLYEPRGRFQLTVEAMRASGKGELYERFLRLKAKLEAEGLFDPAAKREPPRFPSCVGVLSSLHAAALRDVLTTLARRHAGLPVVVYPVPVQGEGAAERIATMLARASDRAECDVLLLVRGGGSIEDLWQFNEERVARAIRASRIPVVVGVGHETDVTIADLAADRRAATPTAAAELVSPSRDELLGRLAESVRCLSRDLRRHLEYAMQALDALARRLVHPAARLQGLEQTLGHLATRLGLGLTRRIGEMRSEVEKLEVALSGLDPAGVLARGYSITRRADGEVLLDPARAAPGERIVTTLARGVLESEVRKKG